MFQLRKTRSRRHSGQTLVELVAASLMLSVALVPGLRLLREGMKLSHKVETASIMSTLSASKLEQYMALAGATWDKTAASGSFASEGYANLRYSIVRSDDSVDGGIPDELMTITSTVWNDLDGDTTLDADEPDIVYSTKIARLAKYEDVAAGL